MPNFMILMHGAAKNWKRLGPEESQEIMQRHLAFVDELKARNHFVGGSSLKHEGFGLRKSGGEIVIDGPFPETKEVLSGYILFRAKNMEAATEVSKRCPALCQGETVQVFEVNE